MSINYDITQYITSIKMSAKKRILVEGRDDKAHIENLLREKLGSHKIQIDTAENIKGNCSATAKNNKAKINKIYNVCRVSTDYKNLYFLCDREFYKFNIESKILDLMEKDMGQGNFNLTIGHSLENYFIESSIICDAYRYLSGSEFKPEAIELFKQIFPSALKIIAAITLAARDIEKSSYPIGKILWKDFCIIDNFLQFDIKEWKKNNSDPIASNFKERYIYYLPIVEASETLVCSRICRGHTAMQMLQRVFSSCLYAIGCDSNQDIALKAAKEFNQLNESIISAALAEAWIRNIRGGSDNYPTNLVSSVAF